MGQITAAGIAPLQSEGMREPALEAMPRERLAALQLQRLRATLDDATARVPWLRDHLQAAGLPAGRLRDVRELDDVQPPALHVKSDLRDHYPFGLFARPVRAARTPPRVVGHHRQADGGRLHARRHRHLGRA